MSFRVGMEVVCVKPGDKPWRNALTGEGFGPEKGDVCVVTEVMDDYLGLTGYGVWLFNAKGFRPVVKRKTDISALEELLNTKRIEELV